MANVKKLKVAAGAVAVALPVIALFEGLVLRPYRDPVGIMTVCYGETNTAMREYTPAECKAMLEKSAREHAEAIAQCLPPDGLPEPIMAASISFAYNVGAQKFCASTMSAKLRAGDYRGGCAELSRWVYAGGKALPGLVKRRQAERAMCERGL